MIILWKRRSLIQITQESEWILGLNHLIGGFVLYRLSLQDVYIVMAFSATTIHTVSILFFLYVRFDECLLDFWYNSHMEQKIFKDSCESRIIWYENQFKFTKQMLYKRPKLIPKLDFKFIPSSLWVRSVCDIFVVCVNSHGYADYIWSHHNFGILPVCMIWKVNGLIC